MYNRSSNANSNNTVVHNANTLVVVDVNTVVVPDKCKHSVAHSGNTEVDFAMGDTNLCVLILTLMQIVMMFL